jgi:hypothetical protein
MGRLVDWPPGARRLGALAVVAGLAAASSPDWAAAAASPPANKIIAMVHADGCDVEQLKPRMEAASRGLASDPATERVAVNWPYGSASGGPQAGAGRSMFVAAIDVRAKSSAIPILMKQVQTALGPECKVETYALHELEVVAEPRTWPLGDPSPGVKLISLVVKRQGLTLPEFAAYWAGPHAKVALESPIRPYRYVENVVVSASGETPQVDGVGEQNFLDPDYSKKRMATPEGKAAAANVLKDTPNLMDMSKLRMFLAQETILKDGKK